MSQRFDNVLQVIGKTPLIRVNRLSEDLAPQIYAKVEYVNPGGSVKDRIALAMVEAAEREGLLKPGGTIIEATSGNTGVGLAMVAAVKGYRCIFIMPDKMSQEKIYLLRAYGAEVVLTPADAPSNSPDGYSGVAARLLNEIPNAWQPNQFGNLVNPTQHYGSTGPEIWEQTEGKVTTFVAGIGTGGTISGVGKYLKDQNPAIKVVAADPEGSVLSGDSPKPWAVEGIGEDYVPTTFSAHVVDDWVRVSDADSFHAARGMARLEGLLVGGSCGTAMAAALQYARRLTADDLVVVLCPDTGRNYLSKMYSDEWMIEQGFMKPEHKTYMVGDLLRARPPQEMLSVGPNDSAHTAVELLRDNSVSQLPVIDADACVGCIRELTMARLLHTGKDPKQVSVKEVMARPMPAVSETTDVDEVYRLLSSGYSGVVVKRADKLVAVVTRIDLVNFWEDRMGAGVVAGEGAASA